MTRQSGVQLDQVAAEFYSDLHLAPFLRRLLTRSTDLLGAVAGSISLVDSASQRYTKMAERGASCRLGQTFPLDEGVTGRVVSQRRPVVLSSYREISAGHLPVGHPAGDGAVAAVPIWWRGDVIGVNVSFAGRSRRFTAQEIDGLEMLTQLAAPGIVEAGGSDPSLANMIREYRRHDAASDGLRTTVTEVGPARPVAPSVAGVALDLVTLAERAAARRRPSARLHVAVVHRADGLRLLVHDDAVDPPGGASGGRPGADEHGWQELADSAGGGVSVQHVAGWGTLVRADLPYQPRGTSDNSAGSPFTAREQQVAGLLASGSSDRMVAKALAISPKTVEKHVGALLRKTGTTSRTAAVVRALGRGWLAPDPAPGGFPPFPPEPPCT